MQRILALVLSVSTGVVGLGATAEAHDATRSRVSQGAQAHHHHHDSCRRGQRTRRVIPRRVWVPAVYRTEVVGYDRCGYAITRRVLVCAGYWRTVYDRY